MDRLINRYVFASLTLLILLECSAQTRLRFVHLEEMLNKEIDSLQEDVQTRSFLYLDQEVEKQIKRKHPNYFLRNNLEPKRFIILEEDKLKVNLNKEYFSVKELIRSADPNLASILQKKFGVNFNKDIQPTILIYKNNAFVEFIRPSSSYALTIKLLEPNFLLLGVAYIVAE